MPILQSKTRAFCELFTKEAVNLNQRSLDSQRTQCILTTITGLSQMSQSLNCEYPS
jgi:hypothetical protein